jgi:hypothetical protein
MTNPGARVRSTPYGVEILIAGPLSRRQAEELLADLQRVLPAPGGRFGVLIDSRNARAFPADTQEVLKRCLRLCQERGLERVAMALDSPIATLQSRRLARETGVLGWSRCIDVKSRVDWDRAAHDWLVHGIDPDPE